MNYHSETVQMRCGVLVVGWFVLPALDHKILGLNLARSRIQLITVQPFFAQSLSFHPFVVLI